MILYHLAIFVFGSATLCSASVILAENFADISTLAGSGWSMVNNSTPGGTTSWFQGNTGVFTSQTGDNSYIAANFDNALFGGDISNWLIMPVLTLTNGDTLDFWTRTENPQVAADRLEVRLSGNGVSTNAGATTTSVGDFTTLLLTVNPALSLSGYPSNWTKFTATVSGLGGPTGGRLAFRYLVPDTATNADYIGIDTVAVNANAASQTPEPSTIFSLSLGIGTLLFGARRRIRG